jgi:hypothetical protein
VRVDALEAVGAPFYGLATHLNIVRDLVIVRARRLSADRIFGVTLRRLVLVALNGGSGRHD